MLTHMHLKRADHYFVLTLAILLQRNQKQKPDS
jgi:hypothetical protein